MELLWPELTATAAQNNLHQALHAARRALGVDCISLADGMVALDADVVCDVDLFERRAADAREAVEMRAYEEALALYGGELLPEDRYELWAEPRRSSLRELHATLCLELARLQTAEDAVLTLQRALAVAPLHEPAHRELMQLYDRLGRRQDALAQFHRLRDALRSELEADPDHETRSLYRELLADTKIAPSAPPLPVQLTSFVGRERELGEVLDLLERSRLLTLTGPGGSGKTRLALAAAERAGTPGDVWFVELGSIFDAALVAEATATVIGIRVPSRRTAAEAVAEHLATKRSLVVLDTCEHVIGACAALAETILRVCPEVTILATSREPLRSLGETTWRVPGLGLPDPEAADTAEAVELFVARARDADPAFHLHEANAADVSAICFRLDGMPLALELAAARVSALSVGEIAARLGDSLDVLSSGARTALTRQQTLRATITWSHELLSGEERVLYRRLSVFAGTFSLAAAEEVCVGGPIERQGVVDLLARLVDKSLVIADEGRYRLLDTIRQFASERLVDAAEVDAIEARLLAWALRLAASHDPETLEGAQNRSLQQLELEHDNVRAALDSGLRHDPQSALLLVSRFWRFWLDRNFFTEGVRRVRAALDATPEPTELRARTRARGVGSRAPQRRALIALRECAGGGGPGAQLGQQNVRGRRPAPRRSALRRRLDASTCAAACADALALASTGPPRRARRSSPSRRSCRSTSASSPRRGSC